jgi:hypothetical protein
MSDSMVRVDYARAGVKESGFFLTAAELSQLASRSGTGLLPSAAMPHRSVAAADAPFVAVAKVSASCVR